MTAQDHIADSYAIARSRKTSPPLTATNGGLMDKAFSYTSAAKTNIAESPAFKAHKAEMDALRAAREKSNAPR